MVGIDLVPCARFDFEASGHAEHGKAFSKMEWDYAFVAANSAERLAGTFAAKEAVMKALGGASVGRFDRIEIVREKSGKPTVLLDGNQVPGLHVSISHAGGFAVAIALYYEIPDE